MTETIHDVVREHYAEAPLHPRRARPQQEPRLLRHSELLGGRAREPAWGGRPGLARLRQPVAVADLHEGERVLDLGSGGGVDVLLSAKRVGPAGRAFGLDMTDEMLALARRNPPRPARRTSSSSKARSRRSRSRPARSTSSSATA